MLLLHLINAATANKGDGIRLDNYIYSNDPHLTFTIAGNGESSVNDGIGTLSASFKWPFGISSDFFNQYIYVSDYFGQNIRQISRTTQEVNTIETSTGKLN